MLRSLMYVTIYVSDQDRALGFYTEGLGLEKRVDHAGPDGRFLTVAPPDASVEILLWPGPGPRDGEGEAPGPRVAPGASPDGEATRPRVVPGPIFLQSDDLYAEFEALRSRGVTLVEPEPVKYAFGVRATALDPDGNRIELRQRP